MPCCLVIIGVPVLLAHYYHTQAGQTHHYVWARHWLQVLTSNSKNLKNLVEKFLVFPLERKRLFSWIILLNSFPIWIITLLK